MRNNFEAAVNKVIVFIIMILLFVSKHTAPRKAAAFSLHIAIVYARDANGTLYKLRNCKEKSAL